MTKRHCDPKKSRRSIRRYWLWTTLLLALFFAVAVEAAEPLTPAQRAWLRDKGAITFVSQTAYPPFEFLDPHGNPQGMCIELVQWMAAELGFKATFRNMAFKQAQDTVLSGNADVLTSLFYSNERERRFDFSEMTWEVPALIFVRAERPDIASLDDLQGKRIAMQQGDYAAEFLKSNGIAYRLVPTATFAEATERMIAGEADAVIGDQQIVLYHLFNRDLTTKVKSVGHPLYIGSNRLAVRDGQSELLGILDTGLALARERGVFERITRKWVGTHYGPQPSWLQRHSRQLAIALAAVAFFAALLIVWGIRLRRLLMRRTHALIAQRTAALQESELKFRELADLLPQTVFEADAKGRITYANQIGFQAFGYSEEDLDIGLNALDMLIPEQRCRLKKNMMRILTGGAIPAQEYTMLRKDGTTFPAIVHSSPIRHDGQRSGLRGIVVDITDRKQMENQIKRNLSFSQSLLNAVPTPVFYKDREGKYLGCNRAFTEVMGTTSHEMQGKTVHEIWPGHQAETYHRKDLELLKNPEYQIYDFEVTDKNGRIRSVIFAKDVFRDEHGTPAGIVGAFLDITDRKQMDEKIRRTMERRRREAEVVAAVAMSLHLAKGAVPELARELTEAAAGALNVERVGVWLFNKARTELVNVDNYVLSTGAHSSGTVLQEQAYQNEFAVLKDAKYIDADDPLTDPRTAGYVEGYLKPNRITAMLDAVIRRGGQNLGVLCFEHVDQSHHWEEDEISFACQLADQVALAVLNREYRRVHEEKSRLEEQYRQAQKLEAIGRLAGGVAHDLNNLLLPILGYAELMLGDLDRTDTRRNHAERIMRASVRARDLVRQLLAFSRKQTLEYKAVDLNQAVTEFAKLLRHTIREDIRIDIAPAPHIRPVKADTGQIEQVIMNLAVNAQDAMPDGGKLTLEISLATLDDAYASTHPGSQPGDYVMLAVSDTGHGMDGEILKQIFEPFFSTKGEQGTGLGLATAYGIVKQHGGNIWVYSEPGKGTTFKIYLPIADGIRFEAPAEKKTVTDLAGSETIVLVEDDQEVRDLAETILDRQGYDVLVAQNGAEALEALRRHDGPVHLMLTDVVMPGMNGRELFDLAVKAHPKLKVLYMSGYTDNVIAHHGVLDEGVQFIQKPFSVQRLAAKIREVLDAG